MKHSFTIDSRREQRSQWKRLLETVPLLVGRLSLVIVTLLLLIGLSLTSVGIGNVAHATAAKNLTQERTASTSSKDIGAQIAQGHEGRHGEHGYGGRHGEHGHDGKHGEHGYDGKHGEHGYGGKHGEHGYGGKHGEHGRY